MQEFDSRALRDAFSGFSTGVTIITTLDSDSVPGAPPRPVAMTANSFSSVSMDPPLLLWSIDKRAQCFNAFKQARYFAAHVLHSGQQAVSNLCATRDADKFSDTPWHAGLSGIPILDEYHICFQCEIEHRYAGGDHQIIVGRVLSFDNRATARQTEPLVFYQGKYHEVAQAQSRVSG